MSKFPASALAVFYGLLGIALLFAPTSTITSPAREIAFRSFGRQSLGISMLVVSAISIVCLSRYISISYLVTWVASLFWLIVSAAPLWAGDTSTRYVGIDFNGPVNLVAILAWGLTATLAGYHYITHGWTL